MNSTPFRSRLREYFLRLVLVAMSLFFAFVLGEIVSRIFFPDKLLRYRNDAEALWYFRPSQVGATTMADGKLTPDMRINKLGLRGDEIDEQAAPHILLLGDSFTFGSGVADSETFGARLNRALAGQGSVVNGGQPGYGIFQMAATLKRVGAQVRPEQVVLVLWQGDFLRQPPSDAERAQFFRQKRVMDLAKSSLLVTHLYRSLEKALVRAGADNLVVRVGDIGAGGSDGQTVVDQYMSGVEKDLPRIRALHDEAKRYGRGVLLVFWPKEDFATLPASEQGLAQKMTERLSTFANENGIPFLSVQPALSGTPSSSLLIPIDAHPNALAHCLVARHIGAELTRLGFPMGQSISCS